jgi:Ca-activated chloride channel family protein
MTFANPQFLIIGLFLIPLIGLFMGWAAKRRRHAIKQLGDSALIRRLSNSINWRGRRWQSALWLVALALVVFSLARPQWGSEIQEIEQEGLQVMIALDVSQSMLAEDIKPTRLDRAKLEIADLVKRLDGDEVGIVLFSGASFLQVPLTSDYSTALSYLDSARPTVISRPGTVIGDAIRTALRSFDPDLPSQKVLIVMTDGEDHETSPLNAAQEAVEQDVLIYTIGFGAPEGAPIPITNDYGQTVGYKTDEQGNMILSKLDDATLQAIAETGNGQYYRATVGGTELDALLDEIDGLQTAQLQSRMETTMIERYQFFLGLALLALIAAELIPDRMVERHRIAWKTRIANRKLSTTT